MSDKFDEIYQGKTDDIILDFKPWSFIEAGALAQLAGLQPTRATEFRFSTFQTSRPVPPPRLAKVEGRPRPGAKAEVAPGPIRSRGQRSRQPARAPPAGLGDAGVRAADEAAHGHVAALDATRGAWPAPVSSLGLGLCGEPLIYVWGQRTRWTPLRGWAAG